MSFLGCLFRLLRTSFLGCFLDFSYHPICVVFLLIQSERGKISILIEHMVLNCGLNPSVRNSTRSFTRSVLVSIKKYLSWLSTPVEKQCADVHGSLMISWTSFEESECGQRDKGQGVKQLWKPRNASVRDCWWDSCGTGLNMKCLYSLDWKIFFSGWNMTKIEDLWNWESGSKKNKLSRMNVKYQI